MRFTLIFFSFSLIGNQLFAQTKSDSTKTLTEVTVKAYLSNQTLIGLPSSATVLNQKRIQQNNISSLVPVLNAVSGVKMEERSPGSYRVSIRGSLLRSPFGVRNIKVYDDDFPLTDASGNTYFNLIDPSAISNIEVLKGPDGSLFGANSGGVVLLTTQAKASENTIQLSGGSYGLAHETFQINQNKKNFQYNIHQAFQYADGYRNHSQLKRYFFQTEENWNYNTKGSLKFSGFYSDLGYQTPGGLTFAQMQNNPKSSRFATATLPSAAEQKAGIYNQTFFGGLRNEYQLSPKWKHVISLSTIQTNFKNPFITNYEKRTERSIALRTYFEYKNDDSKTLEYQWNTGWEFQKTKADIRNYKNAKGTPTQILAADGVDNQLQFFFTRLALQSGTHFKAELSASLNIAKYSFRTLAESTSSSSIGAIDLRNQLMPKLALSYLINPNFVFRGIVSRGYSTPTSAEVRASDQKINTDLQAEYGWNYELGLRARTPFERVYFDASVFYYQLKNAIVRRTNANDQDYYVNAGGTDQKGLELELNAQIIQEQSGLIKNLNFRSSLSWYNFIFSDYKIGSNNFSGNRLTGVPKLTLNNQLNFDFKKQFFLFVNYQFNGKTSLNDAATAYADCYHLIMLKAAKNLSIGKDKLNIYVGIDNLLNEDYSLGNDLNAFGSRYFNPAAKRNYFVGLGFQF
jgi:iron complex outermembrane receptor protein